METPTDTKPQGAQVVIQPTVLGRKNAEYARLRKANVPEKRINDRVAEDAGMFGIELNKYKEALAEVGKRAGGESKRAALKEKKEKIQALHLNVTSFLNELVTVGSTDQAAFQKALKELGKEAADWVLMTAPSKDEKSGEVLFTINDSGWGDGSNRSNQYSDRPQMVGNSGKRTNHPFAIHETATS